MDPDGDIAYFDALLEGEPTEVIEPTPDEETKCGDHLVEVVEEEEHHSWPVVLVVNAIRKTKPRDKAKRRKRNDRDWLRVRSWYIKERKEPMKYTQSSHYMPRIRHGPGKFKSRWSDPFVIFKLFSNSTNKILNVYMNRVELNGFDRVQVKEKPPD